MAHNIKDWRVLISGASSGIGKAAAVAFAQEKAYVILTAHKDSQGTEETAGICRDIGAVGVDIIPVDISDPESVESCRMKVIGGHDHLDILVNNAGVIEWLKLPDLSIEQIRSQININFFGTTLMCRAFLPHLRYTIINVASQCGKKGCTYLSVYSATKFALRGLTQSLAVEWPHRTFYSVNPRETATRMTDFRGDPPEKVGRIIVNAAKGMYQVSSGGDIDVADYIDEV